MSGDHPDIQYLKGDDVGKVIAMALAELYRVKPEFPIDYLSKWLYNYSDQQQAYKKYQAQRKVREEMAQDLHRQKLKKEEMANENLLKQEELKREVNKFETQIHEAEYHDELIADFLPDEIYKLVPGLTAAYIGMYESQKNKVNLEENDDELAHLALDRPKVIQYIGGDQKVRDKAKKWILPEGKGVTYDLFAEQDQAADAQPADPVDDEENEKEPPAKFKYVPDVVSEPNIHFFEIPRLGAYLAVPMIIKSYLNVESFDDAITKLQTYEEQVIEAAKEKERMEKTFEDRIAQAKEAEEDYEEIVQEYKDTKWPEVPQPDFAHELKKYVFCTDTLGQDKDLTQEQIQIIISYCINFVKEWQEKELKYLKDDVRLFNEYENQFDNLADTIANLAEKEEREAISQAAGFGDLPENKINYKTDEVRLLTVKEHLLDKDNCMKHLLALARYRIIKFPRIIQNAFYLAGYKKEDINEPGTNVLNWRKVRTNLWNEEFLKKLLGFTYSGAKNKTVEPYARVNQLSKRVNEISIESVNEYNIGMAQLLRFLQLATSLRLQDVAIRKKDREEKKAQRQDKILEREQREQRFESDEQEHINSLEQGVAYDAEQFKLDWENINPEVEIPPEVMDEEDLDVQEDAN